MMSQRVSIIIPVWNGASVIIDCLRSVYAHSSDALFEVICVDNRSQDDSVALIAERYPQARLLQQPVNLGFAGGVNVGVAKAKGDIFILLNQDCIVRPGWLEALLQAFEVYPEFGIAGCTIFESDGALNHAGAMIRRPEVYGVHLTEIDDDRPYAVEYVTGAAFAIRRQTWDVVGRFDEGYYPGYFEESDYCYRARREGIETAYVPKAHVIHLFSSQEWKADPIKHNANHNRSRYRFVIKHLESREVSGFFESECSAIKDERYFDQAIGRILAARDTLRGLSDIIERRRNDLGGVISPTHRRQLQVGFTQILRHAFSKTEALGAYRHIESLSDSSESWEATTQRIREMLYATAEDGWEPGEWESIEKKLQALRQQEHDLLTRIYFRSPSDDSIESIPHRLFRLLVRRPLSFLIGRDYFLLSKLNTVHVARMDTMNKMNHLHHLHHRLLEQLYILTQEQRTQVCQRLSLLKVLTDYDYR